VRNIRSDFSTILSCLFSSNQKRFLGSKSLRSFAALKLQSLNKPSLATSTNMAPGAIEPTAALDEVVSKPPEGVVLPPRDIRAIVEKTAGYVARNGPVFEERIRTKEVDNPKFSFLNEGDAYNPFYAWRLSEVRAGRGTAVSAGRVGEAVPKEDETPKGPEQPPDYEFSARMPNISAKDLEVVKLTALFVAKNGRSFLTMLAQREASEPQFDFLRPQHSLNQFFTRLIDQYTSLLQGGDVEGGRIQKQRVAELQANVKDRFRVLEKAKKRADWVKWQESQKQQKQEQEEAERMSYAQIDWHDFVVVETVMFTEADDQIDLPPPTSLGDLQSASLEQKAQMSLAPTSMRIEEAMPTYDDYAAPALPVQLPPPVPQSYPAPQPAGPYPAYSQDNQIPIPERAQQTQSPAQNAPSAMQIREGQPGARTTMAARRRNVRTVMCPNCKDQIPFDELEKHMKIELLDPQWREQRAKAESRFATTNLSHAEVANNLKRLASQRNDIFDPVTGQALTEEEQARRKKAAVASYDGGTDADGKPKPPPMGQTLDINEQIKNIHERFNRSG
jgi:splicing factor 3A subunit 1